MTASTWLAVRAKEHLDDGLREAIRHNSDEPLLARRITLWLLGRGMYDDSAGEIVEPGEVVAAGA